jgi:hypothetical protein
VLRLLEAIRIIGLEKETGFIRPQPRNSTASSRKFRRRRPRRSIRAPLTASQSCTVTGSRSTTARPTASMP